MPPRLGDFELVVLRLMTQLDGDPHGAILREAVEQSSGRLVSPGALYNTLDRLERRGLVSSALGESTARRGGKRKRHYHLEPAGRTALDQARASLLSLAASLGALPESKS